MQISPRPNALFELLGRLVELWKSFGARRAAVNELARADGAEMARIAQELGISPADLYRLAGQDKTAANLLYRRLETLRLDPKNIDPAVMRDLQRCCSNCGSKQLCAYEIEDKPKAASWPKYCPNEETIAALTAEPPSPKD
jgi:transposase-like protein